MFQSTSQIKKSRIYLEKLKARKISFEIFFHLVGITKYSNKTIILGLKHLIAFCRKIEEN